MSVDGRALRECLARFTSGVTVVTTRTPDGPHGLTVSAFTSVSLEPPLVLVSVNRTSRAAAHLENEPFCVNILGASQLDTALHFAGQRHDATAALSWEEPGDGPPRLRDCLGYLSCTPWARYDGGDHLLYLGEVRRLDFRDDDPLVLHRRQFHRLDDISRVTHI
ncbi:MULTISPECIES: flavin reductase family protein [unclassified Streptomyces]|jgi:flavin reductase (DIM6/NTAB) family NADH-FMN oxidoreductase RutF|uniref:flavin reductase family protein n=1 Tax=unclassified Streptomyces TaxID=2593676 RepID=UPI00081B5811|nr:MULTISPECIES: flavin reductase family protein [unclassified Streptomyces]MEE1748333.1 flavin reductase family protein [Streptomyces sp. JV184]MYQ82784.1 flavin reductase [Streptomyces sp. SID4936]SCD52721.1 NADH-FMN oxidoreductase RutF, flavin reductase (DIM6/NTAB) family [Streptomyces sp. DvalAA-43]